MTYVIFKNDGVIDRRAITIMGVSSKDTPNAIGYFGTGLKFSIATLLRNGCTVHISAGNDILRFEHKRQKIRNDDFDVIYMNDVELAFTTQLGRDWKMWQAFRELYSNCLDEGGEIYLSDDIPAADGGRTIIAVSGGDFIEQYHARNNIFIAKDERPLEKFDLAEIYEGRGIYYRGVKVKEQVVTLRKYNILSKIDLTEDRTAKYDFQLKEAIACTVAKSSDRMLIERVATAEYNDCFEGEINFDCVSEKPSAEFMDVVGWLAKNKMSDLNDDARKLYERFSPKVEIQSVEISETEKAQLGRALDLCKKLGFPASNYHIDIYETLGDGVLALAEQTSHGKRIILSREIFSKGIMCLTRGLIEEYIHLQYGYNDCTRQMQNFIFDKMTHFGMQAIGEVA